MLLNRFKILSLSVQRNIFVHRNLIPLSQFHHSCNLSDRKMSKERSEDEWRVILSPEQFRIIRQKGTEPPGSGEYNKFKGKGNNSDIYIYITIQFLLLIKYNKTTGIYNCAACDTPLYVSDTKFDSGCGWPAFFESIPGKINFHHS